VDSRGNKKALASEDFGDSVMSFDEKSYGQTYTAPTPEMLKAKAGPYLPKPIGKLVIHRQYVLFRLLNILVDKILWSSSISGFEERSKRPEEFAQVALAKISLSTKSTKPTLEHLLALVFDRNSCLEEFQCLARTEAIFLEHCVHVWWHCRLERIGDRDNLNDLASETDDTISIAFFRVFHDTSISIAIWNYMYRLLQLLIDESNNKAYRTYILQELSNICYFEYARVQDCLIRNVSCASGWNLFVRVSGFDRSVIPRVVLKDKVESFTKKPMLHYMLRLCQPQTGVSEASLWLKNIDDLHKTHHSERKKFLPSEYACLGDLAIITNFIQSLSKTLPLPPKISEERANIPRRSQRIVNRVRSSIHQA